MKGLLHPFGKCKQRPPLVSKRGTLQAYDLYKTVYALSFAGEYNLYHRDPALLHADQTAFRATAASSVCRCSSSPGLFTRPQNRCDWLLLRSAHFNDPLPPAFDSNRRPLPSPAQTHNEEEWEATPTCSRTRNLMRVELAEECRAADLPGVSP